MTVSSTSLIHPTAVIDPSAILGENVQIGPYAIIGPETRLGEGTQIAGHAVIEGYSTLGKHCKVSPGAIIGGLPQDLNFKGELSTIDIGDNVIIRECVTINRATGEGKTTHIGNDSMLMAYTHVAHNCQIGNGVVLANSIQLAGYVEIGDYAFLGGVCVVHQFVRIGKFTMVGGFSGTRQDLPPFALTEGRPQVNIRGVNNIGLKRRGIGLETRTRLKRAFQLLWFSELSQADAIETIRNTIEPDPHVTELVDFVLSSKRGIHKPSKADIAAFEKDTPEISL